MTKLVAIWYPKSPTIKARYDVIEVENDSNIKSAINEQLFNHDANTILINYKNQSYLIEGLDYNAHTYSRRTIEYHPLSNLIA